MHCEVIAQAASHCMPSWSSSRRISSATAMEGWVSFIWNTLCSANFDRSLLPAECHWRSASCRLAEARKYCWRRRNSLPFSLVSLG